MTDLADTPDPGVRSEEALQDPLGRFLASQQQLLDRAYRFIRSRGVSEPDAEEIHTDMLMGFIRFADKRQWRLDSSEYAPVLIHIADKRIRDRARAATRRPCEPVEAVELELLASRFCPAAADAATRLDIRAAIDQLAPKQRTALLYRYFDGFTVDEVAAMMGLSRTAVNKHLRNALAQLKNGGLLADYEPRSTTGRIRQAGTSEAQE
ncbi:sigma-70 family RNA polymerase sigma factor [Amycolatopsis sp. NPDC058278]|uniref:sigma-70 family RNA polymerase sigma factor n=1 Tax=Amycolatopsis sp. NPDC058278 TaxID=3346417 RepID=UPI0036DA7D46